MQVDLFGPVNREAEEKTVIQRTVQTLKRKESVESRHTLSVSNRIGDPCPTPELPRFKPILLHRDEQFSVRPRPDDEGRDNLAALAAEQLGKLLELQAEIFGCGAGLRKCEFCDSFVEERFNGQCRLTWPPAIDRRLPDASFLRNEFKGHSLVTAFLKQMECSGQDSFPRLFIPWTPNWFCLALHHLDCTS